MQKVILSIPDNSITLSVRRQVLPVLEILDTNSVLEVINKDKAVDPVDGEILLEVKSDSISLGVEGEIITLEARSKRKR